MKQCAAHVTCTTGGSGAGGWRARGELYCDQGLAVVHPQQLGHACPASHPAHKYLTVLNEH